MEGISAKEASRFHHQQDAMLPPVPNVVGNLAWLIDNFGVAMWLPWFCRRKHFAICYVSMSVCSERSIYSTCRKPSWEWRPSTFMFKFNNMLDWVKSFFCWPEQPSSDTEERMQHQPGMQIQELPTTDSPGSTSNPSKAVRG